MYELYSIVSVYITDETVFSEFNFRKRISEGKLLTRHNSTRNPEWFQTQMRKID